MKTGGKTSIERAHTRINLGERCHACKKSIFFNAWEKITDFWFEDNWYCPEHTASARAVTLPVSPFRTSWKGRCKTCQKVIPYVRWEYCSDHAYAPCGKCGKRTLHKYKLCYSCNPLMIAAPHPRKEIKKDTSPSLVGLWKKKKRGRPVSQVLSWEKAYCQNGSCPSQRTPFSKREMIRLKPFKKRGVIVVCTQECAYAFLAIPENAEDGYVIT